MSVRGLLLAGAILTSTPVESAALCHRYSVWHYPWAQSCSFGQKRVSVRHEAPFVAPVHGPSGPDIPLPTLTIDDYGGGEPDEVTGARLQLLGYAYAH